MNMLFAFSPFIAFAIVERVVGVTEGLAAGALVSAVLLVRDFLSDTRRVKILEIGTFILFGALSLYALIYGASWSIAEVRLRVDAGLLLVILVSIALLKPFTLQYAREKVATELWNSPGFVRTNYVITFVWALAFSAMVVADLLMIYVTSIPHSAGVIITIAALYAAIKFTGWYPERHRATKKE
jgi:hypothetical protein